ncbi:hypothetical protein GCM10022204_34670 [Microlunatus aurantiacus]|uniref:Protein ImuA n=1 Tax=Microlunatus aurantiacus TaxID=446786 RepID=A0ABP7E0X1_9ACTN
MTEAPTIADLRQRVNRMQGAAVTRQLSLLPGLSDLVSLHTGMVCCLDSPGLAMSLMAGPSRAGDWTAVVGVPEFGFDAALAFGVDLGRCIVVPEPGEHWLSVTAGLVEVTSLVLVRPPVPVSEQQAARMLARLRQKDAALLVDSGQLGDRAWPRPQRRLTVTDNRWSGLGRGHGHLQSRRVTVRSRGGGVPDRTVDLWLPDQRLDVRVETGQPSRGYETSPGYQTSPGYGTSAYGSEVAAG